jgi:hypothetical protein
LIGLKVNIVEDIADYGFIPVTIIVGRQGMLEGRIDGVTDLEEVKKFFQ